MEAAEVQRIELEDLAAKAKLRLEQVAAMVQIAQAIWSNRRQRDDVLKDAPSHMVPARPNVLNDHVEDSTSAHRRVLDATAIRVRPCLS